MDIELLVVEAKKDSVLRVKKGPAFGDTNNHELYIMVGNKAILKKIKTGLAGSEYFEIEDGVEQGDELIISDISSLRKLQEVELK